MVSEVAQIPTGHSAQEQCFSELLSNEIYLSLISLNCLLWPVVLFTCVCFLFGAEYGLRLASHIFVKDISPESLAARDGNIQEGDVVLKV